MFQEHLIFEHSFISFDSFGNEQMLGYYNDTLGNEKSFIDGYFKTGDIIEIDDNGYMYFKGLKKNVIVLSNGENISKANIENKIKELDFIKDVSLSYDKSLNLSVVSKKNIDENEIISLIKDKIKDEPNMSRLNISVYYEV